MKITGLDGKLYQWSWKSGSNENASAPHKKARDLLKQLFMTQSIYEEVSLPGSYGLTADFYLPQKQMMVEIHGVQHYKYVPHFHGTYLGFVHSKTRDKNKRLWCELNKIDYVELPDGETLCEWTKRIIDRGTGKEDG